MNKIDEHVKQIEAYGNLAKSIEKTLEETAANIRGQVEQCEATVGRIVSLRNNGQN